MGNVGLILADDLGYECIGANGGTSYKTPNLDALAAGGMRFDHCYSQPLCTPSRVKIMTGRYNCRNYAQFGTLLPGETTSGTLLRNAGYATCIAGKWQLNGDSGADPWDCGFQEACMWAYTRELSEPARLEYANPYKRNWNKTSRYWYPSIKVNDRFRPTTDKEYGPDLFCRFITDFIKRDREEPFFIYYPMTLTHDPFVPPPGSPGLQGRKFKSNRKNFAPMVAYMDTVIGRIVRALEEAGLRENTLILFTGDNGTTRGIVSRMGDRKVKGGKGQTTDAGTHVPLIANWPAAVPAGRVCEDLVDFSDFLPTLCACAGVTVPEELEIDGRSFLPQLRGEKGSPRQWIYCWYSRSGDRAKAKVFARNRRYKLYEDGNLFDVNSDVLEKHPLPADKLDEQAAAARSMLQNALDRYNSARPKALR